MEEGDRRAAGAQGGLGAEELTTARQGRRRGLGNIFLKKLKVTRDSTRGKGWSGSSNYTACLKDVLSAYPTPNFTPWTSSSGGGEERKRNKRPSLSRGPRVRPPVPNMARAFFFLFSFFFFSFFLFFFFLFFFFLFRTRGVAHAEVSVLFPRATANSHRSRSCRMKLAMNSTLMPAVPGMRRDPIPNVRLSSEEHVGQGHTLASFCSSFPPRTTFHNGDIEAKPHTWQRSARPKPWSTPFEGICFAYSLMCRCHFRPARLFFLFGSRKCAPSTEGWTSLQLLTLPLLLLLLLLLSTPFFPLLPRFV